MHEFSWSTPEYDHHPKTADWYWALGIIALSFATIAVLLDNFLFAVLIILSAMTLCLFAVKEPRIINCQINEHGVVIDDTLYPFSTLTSFGFEYDGHPKLILKSHKLLTPLLIVGISEDILGEARTLLKKRIFEADLEEPLSYKIMEYIGF